MEREKERELRILVKLLFFLFYGVLNMTENYSCAFTKKIHSNCNRLYAIDLPNYIFTDFFFFANIFTKKVHFSFSKHWKDINYSNFFSNNQSIQEEVTLQSFRMDLRRPGPGMPPYSTLQKWVPMLMVCFGKGLIIRSMMIWRVSTYSISWIFLYFGLFD